MKSLLSSILCLLPAAAFGQTFTDSRDIGAVAAAGSTSSTSSGYTVHASGADVWGAQDEFRFVFSPMTGDGEITAKVDGL